MPQKVSVPGDSSDRAAPDMPLEAVEPAPAAEGFASLCARLEAAAGGPVAMLAAERAPVTEADIPLRGQSRKRAALPFAMEDALAAPLDAVHCALGRPAPLPGRPARHLAVAADLDTMTTAGTDRPVYPEVLAVPAPKPDEGSVVAGQGGIAPAWAVWVEGERAVVRAADGTGFATSAEALAGLWRLAGQPGLDRLAQPLPRGLAARDLSGSPPTVDAADLDFDLRQGAFAPAGTGAAAHLRFAAGLAAAALLLHTGLAAADLHALRGLARSDRMAAEAAISAYLPDAVDVDSLTIDALTRHALGAAPSAPSPFLSLLARAMGVLDPSSGLTLRRLGYDAANARLTLSVEGPDLDSLQKAEQALAALGLNVDSGAAVARGGGAEVDFRISGGRG